MLESLFVYLLFIIFKEIHAFMKQGYIHLIKSDRKANVIIVQCFK